VARSKPPYKDPVIWGGAIATILQAWDHYPASAKCNNIQYMTVALCGESGEFANLVKKILRGHGDVASLEQEAREELVDILVYVVKLCDLLEVRIGLETSNKIRIIRERYGNGRRD